MRVPKVAPRPGPLPGVPRTRTRGLLAAARMELGITLVELAARLDVSVGYLSSLESGRRTRPPAESVRRIARGYGLPEALFQSEIGGGGDRAASAAWLRGRAEWHRNRAAELERAAAELS